MSLLIAMTQNVNIVLYQIQRYTSTNYVSRIRKILEKAIV